MDLRAAFDEVRSAVAGFEFMNYGVAPHRAVKGFGDDQHQHSTL